MTRGNADHCPCVDASLMTVSTPQHARAFVLITIARALMPCTPFSNDPVKACLGGSVYGGDRSSECSTQCVLPERVCSARIFRSMALANVQGS